MARFVQPCKVVRNQVASSSGRRAASTVLLYPLGTLVEMGDMGQAVGGAWLHPVSVLMGMRGKYAAPDIILALGAFHPGSKGKCRV